MVVSLHKHVGENGTGHLSYLAHLAYYNTRKQYYLDVLYLPGAHKRCKAQWAPVFTYNILTYSQCDMEQSTFASVALM